MSDDSQHSGRLDELIEDYLARRRRGESPSIYDYAAAHRELAGEILDLFPTLAIVEESGHRAGLPRASFPGLEVLDERAPGVGGMGVVYRAREISLDRIVAVKTARAHLDTKAGRAFFEREARAAGRLDHPHIVRVFSFHPDHEPPYYVMPFVEGQPLREACRGRGARYAAEILEKVALAVAYAHDRGLVHRDLKPQNILVDQNHEPHVTDFGLATAVDALVLEAADGEQTSPRGTPHYIAPELWAQNRAATRRTDVYALGVTMYVLLTDRLPYEGEDLETLRSAIDAGTPPLPIEIDPEIPEPLQRICLKAMEPDPAQRYESARRLADDLRRFFERREIFARPTRYVRERSGRLHNHLTDIQLWRQQRLIDTREMDRMARPYQRMLEADSAWDELSRRFPWGTALLRLGGWLAVLSSVLWPAFYWDDLVRWQRVTGVAAPFFLLNVAGWLYLRRGSLLNAVVFLSTGSLLLPMLVAVTLAEYGWLRAPQLAVQELFGQDALSPPPAGFVLTNVQISVVAAAFTAYALLLLATVRAKVFAIWVGVGAYLVYSSILLLLGLVYWLDHERIAWALVGCLPACLLFSPAAGILRRRGRSRVATVFYSFFPIPFVLVLTALARFGSEEWLRAPASWDSNAVQLWLMVHGLIYLALGLAHVRSATAVARFWGELFLLLVPVSMLVPINVLFEEGPFLGRAGGREISLYECAAVLISVALVVSGTQIRRAALVAPGLVGLAVAVTRITDLHFEGELAWPLGLAITGGLAMVIGACATLVGSKKKTPPR